MGTGGKGGRYVPSHRSPWIDADLERLRASTVVSMRIELAFCTDSFESRRRALIVPVETADTAIGKAKNGGWSRSASFPRAAMAPDRRRPSARGRAPGDRVGPAPRFQTAAGAVVPQTVCRTLSQTRRVATRRAWRENTGWKRMRCDGCQPWADLRPMS